MFGTEEQQKKMLEAIGTYNESIESLGKSFGDGMKKLDEQADDMLEKMSAIKKESNKLMKLVGVKNIIDKKEMNRNE